MNTGYKIVKTGNGYLCGNLQCTGLTPRESQALLLRAQGLSIADCASTMQCGTSNVQDRIINLFYKLRVDSTLELITKSFERGILSFNQQQNKPQNQPQN